MQQPKKLTKTIQNILQNNLKAPVCSELSENRTWQTPFLHPAHLKQTFPSAKRGETKNKIKQTVNKVESVKLNRVAELSDDLVCFQRVMITERVDLYLKLSSHSAAVTRVVVVFPQYKLVSGEEGTESAQPSDLPSPQTAVSAQSHPDGHADAQTHRYTLCFCLFCLCV